LRRQWVTAAGFGVATQQGAVIGPGINQLNPQAGIGPQTRDSVQYIVGVETAGAGVDAHSELAIATGNHFLQHRQRRVVDGFVADIFQRSENRGLAAA